MKPENIYRLTGADVTNYRRVDPLSRAVVAVLAALLITATLLIMRTL